MWRNLENNVIDFSFGFLFVQNEIRRLKQAYRAASHERRFMMYQQREIVRLKDETQKIWNKLGHDKPVLVHDKKPGDVSENADKSISEASSVRI